MRHLALVLVAGTGCLGTPGAAPADAGPGEIDAAPLIACDTPEDCTGTPDGTEAACHCGACAYTDARCDVPGLHYEGGDCVASPVQIDLGYHDACVTMSDGRLYCWGADDCGQLGDQRAGTQCGVSDDHSRVPVLVRESLDGPALSGVQAVATGQKHTCARRGDEVWCWGANSYGQLGVGGESSEMGLEPVQVMTATGALQRIEQITAGYYFNCGLDMDGNGWCWGNNGRGQIGADDWIIEPTGGAGPASPDLRPLAELVDSGFPFDLIVAGGEHACGTTRDINPREVWCWGRNIFGALGWDPGASNASQGTPVHVLREPTDTPVALVGITPLGMGNRFSCAGRVAPDQIWCWGQNAHHALGDEATPAFDDGTTAWVARETAQDLGSPPAEVDGGNDFACALLQNGSLYCWGNNADGQLGRALDPDRIPLAAPGLVMENVLTMATGFDSACAIRSDRKIFCWGNNADGQLGTGDEVSANAPADVEQICP